MENKLPAGWGTPLLNEVVTIKSGNSKLTKKNYISDGKYIAFSGSGPDGKTDFYEHEGDAIILSAVGARCGKCFRASGKWTAIANTSIIRAINKDPDVYRYLFYMFNNENFWPKGGTGQPFVKSGVALREIRIPFPPLSHQKRIADKLDSLLAKVKDTQYRLDTIPKILNRFRQSVIEKVFSNINDEDLVPLGVVLPKGHIFDGPFGSNLKTSDYVSSGVRVVRLENVGRLNFIEEKESYISDEKYKDLVRHTVHEGDIIFASFIADEIRVCVLPELKTKAIAKADCFCIRPDKNINSEYLAFQLTSQRVYDYLVGEIHGVTRPRINTAQLKKLMVYIPSVEEQVRIVRKIKVSLNALDQALECFNKVKIYSDKIEQSILAKAFRGELVM